MPHDSTSAGLTHDELRRPSAVAGFRDSVKWGLLNFFFYPVTPAIYGFCVRRTLGIRAASWVSLSAVGVAVWLVAAIVTFS